MRARLRVWWDSPVQQIFPMHRRLGPDELVAAYKYPVGVRWVRASMVTSLDGAAQGWNGRSGTLSSPADKQVFAILRALADVILVGAGTARAEKYRPDEPRQEYAALREALGQRPTPAIAVVSRRLDLDPDGPLFSGAGESTLVLTTEQSPPDQRAELAERADVVVAGEDRVDLPRALDALTERGLHRILCEGGPQLLGQLVADGLLDDFCLTFAPLLRGGTADRALNGPAVPDVRMRLIHILEDDDTVITRWTRGDPLG
ncbi:MAG TPA: pyrimidine reductase family protein [Jiangellaceae bacterium]|jgi:riboflavin biosynthesis pyrimidine reductase|nr:pyrimidine reductase family protein [Jiangellaceae bacterium]